MQLFKFQFRWKLQKSCNGYEFVPVREKSLARDMKVVPNARRNGRINLPATNATGPDASEMEIFEGVNALHQDSTQRAHDHYRDHKTVCVATAAARWKEERFGCVTRAARVCEDLHSGLEDAAREAWERVQSARRILAEFRDVHRISRPPVHFEGRLWKVAVLVALVVGESLLNTNMFAQASPTAIVGGFSEAFMISAANVLLSAACGYALRLVNARRIALRRIGIAAFWVWLPVILGFHVMVGHYRVSLMAGADNPGAMAVARLMTNPLALHDVQSIILVLLGLVAAVVALCEGYRLDDPYPGYGEAARQVAEAERAYGDLKEAQRAGLDAIIARGRAAVQEDYDNTKDAFAAYEGELQESIHILRSYEALSRHLALTCVRLVRLYRETNSLERTERPPAYFGEAITVPFAPDPWLREELAQAEALIEACKTDHDPKSMAREAERALDALADRYRNAALELFRRIEKGTALLAHTRNGQALLREGARNDAS